MGMTDRETAISLMGFSSPFTLASWQRLSGHGFDANKQEATPLHKYSHL